MRRLALALLFASGLAEASTGQELLADCQAAESFYAEKRATDLYQSVRGTRCLAYISGFVDGYGIGDYLAGKIGLQLNAICLPTDGDLQYRLLRAVLAHLERQPPNATADTRNLVAGALAKAFPCPQ